MAQQDLLTLGMETTSSATETENGDEDDEWRGVWRNGDYENAEWRDGWQMWLEDMSKDAEWCGMHHSTSLFQQCPKIEHFRLNSDTSHVW